MTTEIINQINIISNELRNIQGEEYANQYSHTALELLKKNIHNNNEIQILIEATTCLLGEDSKFKLIDNLHKKIKQQNIKIEELQNDVNELKKENLILKKDINILMKKHYNLILWQAYKNIEYYIIQTITNYDDTTMSKINTNLTEFKKAPENNKYVDKVNRKIIDFDMDDIALSLGKLNRMGNKEDFPYLIEMDELEIACNKMKDVYEGIYKLYDCYPIVYDYFNL